MKKDLHCQNKTMVGLKLKYNKGEKDTDVSQNKTMVGLKCARTWHTYSCRNDRQNKTMVGLKSSHSYYHAVCCSQLE